MDCFLYSLNLYTNPGDIRIITLRILSVISKWMGFLLIISRGHHDFVDIPVRCTLQESCWVPYLTATNIAGASAPGSYLIWCFILCRLVSKGRDKSWSTTNLECRILNSIENLFRCAAPSKNLIGCLTWRLQIFPVLAHLAPTWFDVLFPVGWF